MSTFEKIIGSIAIILIGFLFALLIFVGVATLIETIIERLRSRKQRARNAIRDKWNTINTRGAP